MKQLAIFVLITLLVACGSIRTSAPSRVGIMPLTSYILKGSVPSGDTVYQVYTDEANFIAAFATTDENARQPDFSGQIVVAIVLKDTTAPSALQLERAEIAGSTMSIYAVSCSSGASGCISGPVVMATTPRSGNVKNVQFVVNNNSRYTVTL